MSNMTPERWRRISALLDEALEKPLEARQAWLEQAFEGKPALRSEFEGYLAAAEHTRGLLDEPAREALKTLLEEEGESLGAPDAANQIGRTVGSYRLTQEIGRGGMGVVFLAERADGQFEQRVALKLIKRGLDTDEILGRFQRERQILAHLEHPSIARLLDGGVSEDGQPYFAMEYVDGEPVTDSCDRRRLPIGERLRLFNRICNAVQHAHRNLIVHRDLKPSNILVTDEGEPKLVDFGIAKLLSADDGSTLMTRPEARPLTPAYAAPEQLRGEPVTTATDIYALGVVLYELVSGRRPFGAAGTSVPELERAVLETDPAPPSSALTALPTRSRDSGDEPSAEEIAAARQSTPGSLARHLAGDLDAIVLTALRKEPERRYSSASVLRQDLARHLDHQPILARPDGALYRVGKFVRRHRFGVAATALVVLSVGAGFAGTAWQARQKTLEAAKARQITDFVTGLFEAADPAQAQGKEITARELVEQGAIRLERELEGQPELQAEMGLVLGRINDRLGLSEEAIVLLDRSLENLRAPSNPSSRRIRANALRTKGAALVRLGRAAEAEPLLLEARQEHAALPARSFDRSLEIAEDLDELSIALISLGRLEEAETAASEAFELRLPLLGADHTGIADSYNNLAVVQRQLGRFDEAEVNYKKALEIRIPVLGKEHPDTANTLNNLAALLHYRGRYREAAAMFEELSNIHGLLYGEQHPRTIAGANNLATALMKLGNLERAETLFDSVLTYWRETASEQHPNAIVTRANLGLLYQLRGEAKRAERAASSVVADSETVLGAEHPVTAVLTVRLASVARDLGQYERAKELATSALGVLEKVYGPEHSHVAAGLEELGRTEADLGAPARAEGHLRRAVAIRIALVGEDAFETLAARAALASILRAKGAPEEPERNLSTDLAIGRRVLPENHPVLIDLLVELGRTETAAGRVEEAEALHEEALECALKRYGSDNWRTALAKLRLAELFAADGRKSEARELARRAGAVIEKELGADHPLAFAARNLA